MRNKLCMYAVSVLVLAALPRAKAEVLFLSAGADSSAYTNSWVDYTGTVFGTGTGCTAETADPFRVNGISQGSYIAATSYPMATLSNPVSASAQGLWLGFLMRPEYPDTWAGGVHLFVDTSLPADSRNRQFAGMAGWWGNSMQVSLAGPNSGPSAGYAVADGESIAVLAHFYDTGNSGTFNTGDLYVDANLADGISMGAPLVSGFTLEGAVASIGSLGLAADPVNPETRNYDNILVVTTAEEALAGLNTGVVAIPEPGSLLLVGLAGTAVIIHRRVRRTTGHWHS